MTYLDLATLFADGAAYGMFMNTLYMKDKDGKEWQVIDNYPQSIALQFREPSKIGEPLGLVRKMKRDEYVSLFEGVNPQVYNNSLP